MKKTIFTIIISFCMFFQNVNAQITITLSDLVEVGDTLFSAIDTLGLDSITPGDAGADVFWDFSSLNDDELDTFIIYHPDSTPYSDSFPLANMAFKEGDSSFIYGKSSATDFSLLGVAGQQGSFFFSFEFSPPNKMIEFPSTYLTSFSDSSFINDQSYVGDTLFYDTSIAPLPVILDSIKIEGSTTKYDTMDGWGTILTPLGYYNVLRQKTIEVEVNRTWGFLSNVVLFPPFHNGWNSYGDDSSTTVSYKWYANDLGFAVVELSTDSLGDISSVSYLLKDPLTGIRNTNRVVNSVNAFPNPAKNHLTLTVDGILPDNCLIEVINYLGQVVIKEQLRTGSRTIISLTDIPEGLYLYNVKGSGGMAQKTGKFIVLK